MNAGIVGRTSASKRDSQLLTLGAKTARDSKDAGGDDANGESSHPVRGGAYRAGCSFIHIDMRLAHV